MNKNIKILIGVAVVAIVFFIYKKRKKAVENVSPIGKQTGNKVYAKNGFCVNVYSNVDGEIIETIETNEGDFLGYKDGEAIDEYGQFWYHIKQGTNKPIGFVKAEQVTIE